MKKSGYIFILITFLLLFFLNGCAMHTIGTILDPPGFWYGLLHGFIILFSFIGSIFTKYEIYAYPNSGAWYDFGFLLGILLFFGGGGATAAK